MPPPAAVTLEELFSGHQDGQWVEVEGVVRGVTQDGQGQVLLDLAAGLRRFKVQIPPHLRDRPLPNLIDARIRVQGVSGTIFNPQRQLIGIKLFVPGWEYVSVLVPGTVDSFSLPLRSTNTLLQFRVGEDPGHRVRVRGVVTHLQPGSGLYIQDEAGGLFVKTTWEESLEVGALADVIGFEPPTGRLPRS